MKEDMKWKNIMNYGSRRKNTSMMKKAKSKSPRNPSEKTMSHLTTIKDDRISMMKQKMLFQNTADMSLKQQLTPRDTVDLRRKVNVQKIWPLNPKIKISSKPITMSKNQTN